MIEIFLSLASAFFFMKDLKPVWFMSSPLLRHESLFYFRAIPINSTLHVLHPKKYKKNKSKI